MDSLTTFTAQREFERALTVLETLGIAHTTIDPGPAYRQVGIPALVLTEEARSAFFSSAAKDIVTAGWVDFRPPTKSVPGEPPPDFAEDILGRIAIVLLAPCVADLDRLRLTAHFSGDVAAALPYLNAELPQGSYIATLPVLTFMDGHRMVSLFRDRIAVAKANDIVDAWATLERLRCLVNDVWSRRAQITPSTELRRRPPAIEIYKRLPQTNCRECGEAGCTAFAWAVWRGEADPQRCVPVFDGDRGDLKGALRSICSGLGVSAGDD